MSAIILTPFVIGRLGLQAYGLYILAFAIATFLGSFDGGLTSSAGRFFSVYIGQGDADKVRRMLITLSCGATLIGLVFVVLLSLLGDSLLRFFHTQAILVADGRILLTCLAIVVLLGLVRSVFVSLLNAVGQFRWASLSFIISYVVFMGAVLVLLSNDYGLRGLAIALLAQGVLGLLLVLPAIRRLLPVGDNKWMTREDLRDYATFAGKVQLIGLAGLVNNQVASLILGRTFNVAVVGVYNVGANLANQIRTVPANALRAATPYLGRAYGESGWKAHQSFAELQRAWVRFISGWFAVATGAGFFVVQAWLGTRFSDAGEATVILLVGSWLVSASGVLLVWLQVTGYPGVEAAYSVFSVFATLVLLAVLAPFLHLQGVALAISTSQLLSTMYLIWRASRTLPFKPPSIFADVPLVATLAAAVASALVEQVLQGHIPRGSLGLLSSSIAVGPLLALYLLWVFRAEAGKALDGYKTSRVMAERAREANGSGR